MEGIIKMKKILSRKNVLVDLFALCLTFAWAFGFNVKTARADSVTPDATVTEAIATAIENQPDIDTISVADFGMGYIGETKEFKALDQWYAFNLNSNNVLQSLIFKFYYSPASDFSAIELRIGFTDSWGAKVKFDLTNGLNMKKGDNSASLANAAEVFADAAKEYLVEIKVIRVKDSNTLISASVDGTEKINASVADVGEYTTGTDNRIHFYTASTNAWTIRDFREIDTNYDVITTHDVEHWHPTEKDVTVKDEVVTLERTENKDGTWSGTGYFGWWDATNDDANVVYKFYYNTGDKVTTEDPFTIRMRPTTGDKMWVGLKVTFNHWSNQQALRLEKENSDDSGAVYALSVFTETNKDYLIEIGVVGIKDSDDKGYIYVKVDGKTLIAITFSSDVYKGRNLSYWSSNEINRTISSVETVKVYNENGEKIDEYGVKYDSAITAPEYTPGNKAGDKYYGSYEYKYWSANGKDEFDFANDKIQSDIELKPYYLGANAKEYEITFKGNGSEQKVKYSIEKELVEPAVPAKEYYTGAWASYEPKYEDNQVVEAVYTAIEYKVTVKFAYDDTKEDVEFKFSADNTAEEIAAILKQIQELNTDKKSYAWDVEPTELKLGANVEYTLNKVETEDGCFGSITSNSWLFVVLALSAVAFAICSAKKQKNN